MLLLNPRLPHPRPHCGSAVQQSPTPAPHYLAGPAEDHPHSPQSRGHRWGPWRAPHPRTPPCHHSSVLPPQRGTPRWSSRLTPGRRSPPPCPAVFLSLIHISEPTRRTPISYAVFCLKKKKNFKQNN